MTVTFHGSHYSGVSGDTKPTLTSTDAGALFAETNTDQLHVWNGSGWDAALATSTMTLTNKTLTAPDINGGTVDAITSLTVANNVDVGNYTVRASNFLADSHTAGRVLYTGTNGVFSSEADLAYNATTNTLTATNIAAFNLTGKLTAGSTEIEGSAFDIDGGDMTGVTISGALTWSAAQDLNSQALTNANIDTGDIASAVVINKSPVITLAGDLTGNVTLSSLANGTLTATIAADSVALATDTTGNYVATVAGTTNEIDVSGSGSENAGVTVGIVSNPTLTGNVTVTGNLEVQGDTVTLSTSAVTIEDTMLYLSNSNSADSVDIGFYGKYVDSGTKYSGFFRDASDSDKWKLFATTGNSHEAPTSTINTTSGFTLGVLEAATFIGALTGNASGTAASWATARTLSFTGDVTGSGSVNGGADVATALTIGNAKIDFVMLADDIFTGAGTAFTSVDPAADFLLLYDTSGTAIKRVIPNELGVSGLAVGGSNSIQYANGTAFAGATNAEIKNTTLALAEMATPNAVAGYGLLYAKSDNELYYRNDTNSEVKLTNAGSIAGGGAFRGTKLKLTNANNSISNNSATTPTAWSEIYDVGAIHDASSNTDRITFGLAGYYQIQINQEWQADAAGYREMTVTREDVSGTTNDGVVLRDRIVAPTSQTTAVSGGSTIIYVDDGSDYVTVQLYQNSGAALNAIGATDGGTFIVVTRIDMATSLSQAAGGAGYLQLSDGSGGFTYDNGQLFFDTSNNRLGIGTGSPSYTLDVTGTFRVTGNSITALVRGSNGSAGAPTFSFNGRSNQGMYSVDGNTIGFAAGGAEKVRVDNAGTVTIYADASDGGVFEFKEFAANNLQIKGGKDAISNLSLTSEESIYFNIDSVDGASGLKYYFNHDGQGSAGDTLASLSDTRVLEFIGAATVKTSTGVLTIDGDDGIVLNTTGGGDVTISENLVVNGTVTGTGVKDEDTMSSNSATHVATQQSIKAYVDAQITTEDTLAELNDTNITSPADASFLIYDTGTSTWRDYALSGDISVSDAGAVTIAVNSVALATDTTGNYVAAITAGTGLTSNGATSGENISHSLSVDASQTQITAIGTVTTGTWEASTIAVNKGGTGQTTIAGYSNQITSVGTLSALTVTGETRINDKTSIGNTAIPSGDEYRLTLYRAGDNNTYMSFQNGTPNYGSTGVDLSLLAAGGFAISQRESSFVRIDIAGSTKFQITSDGDTTLENNDLLNVGNAASEWTSGALLVHSAAANSHAKLELNMIAGGTGDAIVRFQEGGTNRFTVGIDDNDSEKFVIARGGDLGTNNAMEITSSGAVTIPGVVTFNEDIYLGDSDRIRMGDSQDLQIYHENHESVITHNGAGNLTIESANADLFLKAASGERIDFLIASGRSAYISAENWYFENNHIYDVGHGDNYWTDAGMLIDIPTQSGEDITKGLIVSNVNYPNGKTIIGQYSGEPHINIYNSSNVLTTRIGVAVPTFFLGDVYIGSVGAATGSFSTSADTFVVGSGTANEGMTVYSGANHMGNIFFTDGVDPDGTKGYIQYGHGSQGEKMFFGADGDLTMTLEGANHRVGIGLSAPLQKLHVVGNIRADEGGSNYTLLGHNQLSGQGTVLYLQYDSAYDINLFGGSTDRTLVSKGKITLAESATGHGIHVSGTKTGGSTGIRLDETWNEASSAFYGMFLNITNTASASSSSVLRAHVGGAVVFNVPTNASVEIGNSTHSTGPRLTVYGGAGDSFIHRQGTSYRWGLGYSSPTGTAAGFHIYTAANSGKYIMHEDGNHLLIWHQGTGNVGIGATTDPTERLHVTGNILATGDVTAYSDMRLKENIVPITSALDKVSQMKGVNYNFIESGELGVGVLAQDLEKVAPELVHEGHYKSVAYGNLTAYLVEAIKELKKEIIELKKGS